MARTRTIALALAAAGGIAGSAWWLQRSSAPAPRLRDPARIDAVLRPAVPIVRAPFVADRSVVAAGCPLPVQAVSPDVPAQTLPPARMPAFVQAGGRLQPLAGFGVDARVLSVRAYDDDREAEFAPIDIALGWGRMRDDDVLRGIEVNQQGRWYYTRWRDAPEIPIAQLRRESANMHMIPANHAIGTALAGIEKDQRIRIDGWLVEVQARDGWRWRSSTRRDDHGPGGCEVVYVCGVAIAR